MSLYKDPKSLSLSIYNKDPKNFPSPSSRFPGLRSLWGFTTDSLHAFPRSCCALQAGGSELPDLPLAIFVLKGDAKRSYLAPRGDFLTPPWVPTHVCKTTLEGFPVFLVPAYI